MASTSLMAAEVQWREQFAAMRAALADLKLPSPPPLPEDDDWDHDDSKVNSSVDGGQDVWDFISDDEEAGYGSDFMVVDTDALHQASGYGHEWLTSKFSDVAARNGLAPDVFTSQIMGLLRSGQSEQELQANLTDLVGFDDLEFVIELLSQKGDIVDASPPLELQTEAGPRLLSRSQREEALRRQDAEHKSAVLAPSHSKEPQYPHVYKAYHAGNTLSVSGKNYGLPVGSQRLQFDKYEEYSVPAGRKGTPGPGEKLVKIADLDGLCANTFKGYKALNRMQSLVFPVAYKTSENMLICAPTGAVR